MPILSDSDRFLHGWTTKLLEHCVEHLDHIAGSNASLLLSASERTAISVLDAKELLLHKSNYYQEVYSISLL